MDLCLIAEATSAFSAESLHAWVNWAGSVGMVALGLGFVIFVHELGHFLAAKACGVKAEKFYVGFDIPMPKILGWQIPSRIARFQWGETEYGIGILPLGGYVKMLGQDDNPGKFKEEQERAKAKADGTAAVGLDGKDPIKEEAAPVYDPRSYQAKNVPQRMLIISAGVIMNLIFAVLMAAFAYSQGVPYTPTIVGSTIPSGGAWTQDFRPGDKIIRIGSTGPIRENLRWKQDLIPRILLANGKEIELLVRRDGKELTINVAGTKPEGAKIAMLGLAAAHDNVIAGLPELPRLVVNKTKPELKPGDRIVRIDGTKIDDYAALQAVLAGQFDKTLELEVERPEIGEDKKPTGKFTKVETKLPPQPLRRFGFYTAIGPVSQIRRNSPAEKTGVKVGDQIVSINGEPVGDPFTLSQRLVGLVGQDVTLDVERKVSGKTRVEKLKIAPEAPRMTDAGVQLPGETLAIEPLGLAVPVEFKIVGVTEGSPAAKAKLRAGDEITHVQFMSEDADVKNRLAKRGADKPITLSGTNQNLVYIEHLLQSMPDEVDVEITYQREGQKASTVVLTPASGDGYLESRGLVTAAITKTYTAQSAGEAMALGFRETKEKLFEVANVLGALVTGRIPPDALGGPITIARAAFMEASEGWGTLLIFLTLLSANLALINFLPIPVLDGGHMVFLAYEGVTGKPANEKVQYYALLVGFAMLMCLMVFVFRNDIMSLL